MQGQVKFKLQKLCILQVVSAGFPHFKSDVTTCFSCGNCHTPSFQIDSACYTIWIRQVSASFSQWKQSGIQDKLAFRIVKMF